MNSVVIPYWFPIRALKTEVHSALLLQRDWAACALNNREAGAEEIAPTKRPHGRQRTPR